MLYACTTIDRDRLTQVQALERELGTTLLALTPIKADPAPLPARDLGKIRALEDELGVVLVAVNA